MVRTTSAAAVLLLAAGLASRGWAQSSPTATPSISETMQKQAQADARPAPPPPPGPLASPSTPVARAFLAPAAAKARYVFAPPAPAVVSTAGAVVAPERGSVPTLDKAVVVIAAPLVSAAPALATSAAPAVAAVRPVPAPGAPSASALVARRVTDAAGAFDAWTDKAARLDGRFADAAGVSAALTDASAIQTDQLEEGAVAYGALAALQDPVFVQSAHDLAASGGDHDAAAAILLKRPAEVMTLAGADGAAAFAAQALAERALAVTEAGKAVRRAAYSMQADPWARTPIPAPEKRLADVKQRASAAVSLDDAASAVLMTRLVALRTSRQSFAPTGSATEPTPLVTRALALAAMIVLGEGDEAHAAKLTPLLVETKSGDCLKMARLNFFQCVSVAGPHYEDAFCIGQHGLGEAGQCLATAVGAALPVAAPAAPATIAAATPAPSAGVSVPIALLAENGPERVAAAAAPVVAPPSAVVVSAGPTPQAFGALLIAQADAASMAQSQQPIWARDPAPEPTAVYAEERPRAYARQPAVEAGPYDPPRYDAGRAYAWDRQTRPTGYAAPGYGASPYAAYATPRQADGRYLQPGRPAYDPREDDADDEDASVAPRAGPQQGYRNDR